MAAADPVSRSGPQRTVEWRGGLEDGRIALFDPQTRTHDELRTCEAAMQAMARPGLDGSLLAILAAYAVVLEAIPVAGTAPLGKPGEVLRQPVLAAIRRLASRSAAPALSQVMARMQECSERHFGDLTALELCARLLMEARRVQREADAPAG